MSTPPDNEEKIKEYITALLGINEFEDTPIAELYNSALLPLPISPDFIIKSGKKVYSIEIKNKVTIDSIARLNLYNNLMRPSFDSDIEFVPIIATKNISAREEKIAKDVGIKIILLPWDLQTSTRYSNYQENTTVKVTSAKSWKIISHILKESTSIRQLSIHEHVSYGWAHKIVNSLLDQGIAQKSNHYVAIIDTNKLLNGIAWERPMKNLLQEEVFIDANNAFEAATEITKNLDFQQIPHAFTGRTAGGLYTGYALRNDAADLYLNPENIHDFKENLVRNDVNGIKIFLYSPDRDIFSNTILRESVRVASPAQTLLDLAGMGYQERDLTKSMVEAYGSL